MSRESIAETIRSQEFRWALAFALTPILILRVVAWLLVAFGG